jgi:DNA-binding transcriptional LysR family regulator
MDIFKYSQDFSKLKQFYFVAKAGSLTNAAQILNLDHSSLSKAMKYLEGRIKTKLFKREGSGLKLTADGERLFEHVAKLLHENDSFLKNFLDSGDELRGEIKIITTPAEGETVLTHYLLPFLEEHPNLSITVLTAVDDFHMRYADVAIRTHITGGRDLEQLPLRTVEMKLWASSTYLQEHGLPSNVTELDRHKLLVYRREHSNLYFDALHDLDWILNVGNNSDQPRKPFYQIMSHEGLYHAASKGYGIAQFPEEYVKIKGSNLIEILSDIEKPIFPLYFICTKKAFAFKRIKVLYTYLRDCYTK